MCTVHSPGPINTIVLCELAWVFESAYRYKKLLWPMTKALNLAGLPCGARSDKLLYQAKLALNEELRLKVVRKYSWRLHLIS